MIEFDKPARPICNTLFVYCDLKHKGKQNQVLLSAGCRLIGRAKMNCFVMYDILNSYPMIIPSNNENNAIVGELWHIGHAKLLDTLDRIKSPMSRDLFQATNGKKLFSAWAYYMPEMQFNDSASGVKKNKDGKWKV